MLLTDYCSIQLNESAASWILLLLSLCMSNALKYRGLGGCIALSAGAVYSDDVAICRIMSSFWRSISSLRCCSSNYTIPIPSNCVKYGDALDIVANLVKLI